MYTPIPVVNVKYFQAKITSSHQRLEEGRDVRISTRFESEILKEGQLELVLQLVGEPQAYRIPVQYQFPNWRKHIIRVESESSYTVQSVSPMVQLVGVPDVDAQTL